jgi:hypothetical protein
MQDMQGGASKPLPPCTIQRPAGSESFDIITWRSKSPAPVAERAVWRLIFASPFSWHLLKPFFFISSNLLSSFESYKLQSWKRCYYRRDILKTLHAQIVKTKLSCEPSFQHYELKVWHRSFRARLQRTQVEVVKTKLSCETSLKKWKMWKRSFPARLPSKSEGKRRENEASVRDSPHKVKVEEVKTKLSCEYSLKKWG